MKDLREKTVLLTGASGGVGVFIARAFARSKAKLALVAYPGIGLEALRQESEQWGGQSLVLVSDLRDPAQRRSVVEQVRQAFGPIDVLVNGAGVEVTAPYDQVSEEDIRNVISINLEAGMVLTRLILPEMLRRRSGHVVNISSLAGKFGPAFEELYSATKAGLIGFTSSLRASCRGSGVSASVIIPSFVEAGIYAQLKVRSGCEAPAMLRGGSPEQVAQAVVRAIRDDIPEIIINRYPVRPALALAALSPTLGNWLADRIGAHDFFRRVVEAKKENQTGR
jgi:short-subunit dehydrogenase